MTDTAPETPEHKLPAKCEECGSLLAIYTKGHCGESKIKAGRRCDWLTCTGVVPVSPVHPNGRCGAVWDPASGRHTTLEQRKGSDESDQDRGDRI